MAKIIDNLKCIGCGICERVCLVGCISQQDDKKRTIDTNGCVNCDACEHACPKKCIS